MITIIASSMTTRPTRKARALEAGSDQRGPIVTPMAPNTASLTGRYGVARSGNASYAPMVPLYVEPDDPNLATLGRGRSPRSCAPRARAGLGVRLTVHNSTV